MTWRIYDATGRRLDYQRYLTDTTAITLDRTGEYFLVVDSTGSAATSYTFVFNESATSYSTVAVGETVEGRLSAPGGRHVYLFDLTEPMLVGFDAIGGNSTVQRTLYGPDGQIVDRWGFNSDRGNAHQLRAGRYALAVTSSNATTPDYAFRLLALSQGQEITAGTPVTGVLNPGSSSIAYRFSGQAGERVFLNPTQLAGTASYNDTYWALYDPSGTRIFHNGFSVGNPPGVVSLTSDGDYVLVVEGPLGNRDNPIEYAFRLQPIADELKPLTLGERVSDTIAEAGAVHRYRFALTQATSVAFDALINQYNLAWSLERVGGSGIASGQFTQDVSYGVQRLAAGEYVLSISGNSGYTGDYYFNLLNLAAASPIATGATVYDTLDPANQTRAYAFDAAAGDRLFIDTRALQSGVSPYALRMRLLGPSGESVLLPNGGEAANGYFFDVDTFRAPLSGRYTLLVQGAIEQTAPVSFSFLVAKANPAAPVAIPSMNENPQPAPDLAATNVVVTGVGGDPQSGGEVTVAWTESNTGSAAAQAVYRTRVVLRNVATGDTLSTHELVFAPGTAALGVAGSIQRSLTIRLPEGAPGIGQIVAIVTVDVDNAVAEGVSENQAENNNAAEAQFTAVRAATPDLTVKDVAVSPAGGYTPGQAVTISWITANAGDRTVSASFFETVNIRNTRTNQIVATRRVAFDTTAEGSLGPLGEKARSVTLAWPDGTNAGGDFQVVVSTDSDNTVVEAAPGINAEQNNTASLTLRSAPDLAVSNFRITSAIVQSGGLVTLSWTEANLGNAPTTAGWTDMVYVYNLTQGGSYIASGNAAYDPVTGGGPIGVGESRQRSVTLRLPEGEYGAGELRFDLFANNNYSQRLNEGTAGGAGLGDGNNSASLSATSLLRLYPDLSVKSVTVPTSVTAGQSFSVTWVIENLSSVTAQAANFVDRLSIETANGLVLLGEVTRTGPILGESSVTITRSFVMPTVPAGDYRVRVETDRHGANQEPDTRANNTGSSTETISVGRIAPDLVIGGLEVAPNAVQGDAVTVKWTVTNAGQQATGVSSWTDRVYLSRDGVIDGGDTLLGAFLHSGALAVGGSYAAERSITVPRAALGEYRILVRSDADGQVDQQGRTSNDLATAPITIAAAPAANLVTSALSAPGQVQAGASVALSWTVTNAGNKAATESWVDRIFVERTDGSGRIFLADVTRPEGLAAGAAYSQNATITMPQIALGSYRFVVVSDVANAVDERAGEGADNETNAATSVVSPNLVVSAVSAPPAAFSGDPVTVNYTVRNTGNGPATGAWIDRVYLSADDAIDGADVLVGTFDRAGPLAAGGEYAGTASVTLGLGLSGSYRFIVVTDAGNAVTEIGAEGDNGRIGTTQVTLSPYADLSVSNVTAPERTIRDPAVIDIGWTVTNNGTGVGRTSAWEDVVVLSADDVYGNGDDRVLGRFVRDGALAVGASYSRTEQFFLPAGYSGRVNVFVRTDGADAVFENGSEANNLGTRAGKIDIMPVAYADLVIASTNVPPDAQSGRPVTISWSVKNQGIGRTNSESWTDTVFVFADAALTQLVAVQGFDHIGALAKDEGYSRSGTLTLPNGLTGTVYVLVQTGGPFEFVHTDNNRSAAKAMAVTLSPSADLRVDDLAATATVSEGGTIDVAWRVVNDGEAEASGRWTDTLVLQPVDTTKPPIVIGSFVNERVLPAGQSYQRTERFTLPQRIEGVYRLVVTTNADRGLYETSAAQANNSATDDGTVSISLNERPNLQVQNVVATPRVTAGGTVSVEFDIVNQGNAATSTPFWQDAVYLSSTTSSRPTTS